jgi:hypothetical protein
MVVVAAGSSVRGVEIAPPATVQVGRLAEFRLSGLPAASNPFDPDAVRVDGVFTSPDGGTLTVPAFWYRAYSRRLEGGREQLSEAGAPEWRLRYLPQQAGVHSLRLNVTTNGQPVGGGATLDFAAGEVDPPPARRGFVRLAANRQHFATGGGQALPLVGHCVCWHGNRGTFDYDDWFGAMARAGQNYARLWMAPWALGIEAEKDTRLNYRLDRAWQLDYVLQLAERHGIYLMLCFDYHGMFETQPDYWGGNDNWKINPYNAANGGPCVTPNDFFRRPEARQLYQKRLRYLIARYGYSPHVLAWQFFNEIDNVYRHLTPADVVAWHRDLGAWLKANDPWEHLVTTSLTGGSDRADIWKLPEMDFAMYHSYNQSQPTAALPAIAQRFLAEYGKPVMIGEFGTDWRGWRREQDPFLRGWRQGLWAGALSGSVGTSMSWWWEAIHAEGLYPTFQALGEILRPAGWGAGDWAPLTFETNGAPPTNVGEPLPGGSPFTVTLPLDGTWGAKPVGAVAVADEDAAAVAAGGLNSFVHGTAHADLRTPFRLDAWFTNESRLVLRLNSVSQGAVLGVFVDGAQVFRRALPNKDGQWLVNGEYNEDLAIELPAGRRRIEVRNLGADWFYLDWVRLENVLPAGYANGWRPSPVAVGLRQDRASLVYVVNPRASYPANATQLTLRPLEGGELVLRDLPAGRYRARWFRPSSAQAAGETVGESDGARLRLPLPEVVEDLAGWVRPVAALTLLEPRFNAAGKFEFAIVGEAGQGWCIEASDNCRDWRHLTCGPETAGGARFADPTVPEQAQRFYRARAE